jgi:16S rRNA (guanine(1405)-N(7))-methyltransferase
MQTIINQLLHEIKRNKKYSTITDEIVLEEINNYLKKNKLEKITKQDIKEIRNQLHRLYSSYLRGNKSKRNKLIEQLKENPNSLDIINKILATSVSAKERLEGYENIYNEIFNITGKPKTIVDIGCGLNPISYPYIHVKELTYYCYDIDTEDIDFLNEFFKIMKPYGLNGKAQILNARNLQEIAHLPSSDITFIWKLIDLINTKDSKPGEELIQLLINKTKFIVASFATRTIGGKPMNLPRRKGFELMLERINLKYNNIKTRNEIYYIICRN